jgi:hypothetical protein
LVFAAFLSTAVANDLLQPNPKHAPCDVVEIQLRVLQQNDDPVPGAGNAQNLAFVRPNNRVITGSVSFIEGTANVLWDRQ